MQQVHYSFVGDTNAHESVNNFLSENVGIGKSKRWIKKWLVKKLLVCKEATPFEQTNNFHKT